MGKPPTETGVCRLSLSDLDKEVRDWFITETNTLGCNIKVDKVGNIFAIYPGKNLDHPTAIGSHLDTQPMGGRYDGVLGVLAGLDVLKIMKENFYVPNYPISVVNWTNEEGARFPVDYGFFPLGTKRNRRVCDEFAIRHRSKFGHGCTSFEKNWL